MNASIICLLSLSTLLYPQLNAITIFALYIHDTTASGTVSVSNHVYSLASITQQSLFNNIYAGD